MSNCPKCGRRPETPLYCESCGDPLDLPKDCGPFEIFGMSPAWHVDRGELRARLLRLSRGIHPDYFGSADAAVRARAERNTAELNAAFELLGDDMARADWLVRHLRGPSETERRDMPRPFLADVLEWNEALAEARAAPGDPAARARVDALDRELQERRAELKQALAEILDPLPPTHAPSLIEARRALNAARYIDRSLAEIRELRVAQAARA